MLPTGALLTFGVGLLAVCWSTALVSNVSAPAPDVWCGCTHSRRALASLTVAPLPAAVDPSSNPVPTQPTPHASAAGTSM